MVCTNITTSPVYTSVPLPICNGVTSEVVKRLQSWGWLLHLLEMAKQSPDASKTEISDSYFVVCYVKGEGKVIPITGLCDPEGG